MHIRTPRAAVDAAFSSPRPTSSNASPPSSAMKAQTLWASRPLSVLAGRVVAVRLIGTDLWVALVEANAETLRWVAADAVLSVSQAEVWAKTSTFRPSR